MFLSHAAMTAFMQSPFATLNEAIKYSYGIDQGYTTKKEHASFQS